VTLSLALYSQVQIQQSKAKTYKGDTVYLIGFITDVKQVINKKDYSILMYLETSTYEHPFMLLFSKANSINFKKPSIEYLNQYVQVTGVIRSYKGKPGIMIYSDNQIAITREVEPEQE
jgi:hypothetical protein